MKKLTTETTRFLNHIDRTIKSEVSKRDTQISILRAELAIAVNQRDGLLQSLTERNAENDSLKMTVQNSELTQEQFLSASKNILKKLRIDIYSETTTPRFFKTGRYWSRETGGFSEDEISTLTTNEIVEALEFYSRSDVKFLNTKEKHDFKGKYRLCCAALRKLMKKNGLDIGTMTNEELVLQLAKIKL
jgi:hypothetical protein